MESVELLQELHRVNPNFRRFVDLHLVIDRYDRQFNLWRNIARFFARSQLILTMDVDFMLCSDLRANYQKLPDELKLGIMNASMVLVVPAFEFEKGSALNEMDVSQYPKLKQDMLGYVEKGYLIMFHHKWRRGHAPSQYDTWSTAKDAYRVTEYNYNYEPYILMRRDGLPWCDERFVGYGSNKAACLYEIYLAGVEFWVMPEDFLIHQRHPYPENDRRVERKYNKRLFDVDREEACFRYARMHKGVGTAQNDPMGGDMGGVDERICGSNMPNYYGL